MKDYHREFDIKAEPQKVYDAISKQKGLENWWTDDCDVESKEGAKATFRFGKTYAIMLIEKLVPQKQVVWKCIDQRHVAEQLAKQDEWAGTRIIFNIQSDGAGGTELSFTHEGLNESLECYDICNEKWDYFLKQSLKGYLETGKGLPEEKKLIKNPI